MNLPVYYFKYKTRREMCLAWGRIVENFETTELKNKVLSRDDIRKHWKPIIHDDYFDYWDGFNITNKDIQSFVDVYRGLLITGAMYCEELTIWSKIPNPKKKYSIITAIDDSTFMHELAHALFYLIPDYKRKQLKILKDYDTEALENNLKREMGYEDKSIKDEALAHIIEGDEKYFKKYVKLNVHIYDKLRLKLLDVFTKEVLNYIDIKIIQGD